MQNQKTNRENLEDSEFGRYMLKHESFFNSVLGTVKQSSVDKLTTEEEVILKIIERMDPLQRHLYYAKKRGENLDAAREDFYRVQKNASEHKKRVLGYDPLQKPVKKTIRMQLLDLNDSKRIFWEDYLSKSTYPDDFEIDDNNKEEIQELFKYFIRDRSCRFDLSKGIFLCGGIGSGKTNLMRQLSAFTKDHNLETAFEFISMNDYSQEVAIGGISVLSSYSQGDYCFDDIAASLKTVTHFGTQMNPLDDLIFARYQRFTKNNSKPTHFTSNVNFATKDRIELNAISQAYDMRCVDRVRQMCNFVYLGGGSRRK